MADATEGSDSDNDIHTDGGEPGGVDSAEAESVGSTGLTEHRY